MKNFSHLVKSAIVVLPALFGMLDNTQAFASTECVDVVIVGGGPAGLLSAYRLTNPDGADTGVDPSKVVLLEKNDYLGGRIEDVQFGPNPEDVVGTGAYRMYDTHYTYFLCQELGVDTVAPKDFNIIYGQRDLPYGDGGNYFGYSPPVDFEALYGVNKSQDDIWNDLLCGPQVPKDAEGNPYYQFVDGMGTKSTLDYLKYSQQNQQNYVNYFLDTYRFRGGDFLDPVDAASYMDYTAADYAGGPIVYANPGFSALVTKLRDATIDGGGRIYLNEAVTNINEDCDGNFLVEASCKKFKAKHVIIATTHGAIKKMQGNVPTAIVAQKEYQFVAPAEAITVTHKWNKRWWNKDLRYPDVSRLAGEQLPDGADPILRTITNLTPEGYNINTGEFPVFEHWDDLRVTRSLYTDLRDDIGHWLQLYVSEGTDAMNEKILLSYRLLFPDIFDGSKHEPKIEQTHLTYHDEAWYFFKQFALENGVTANSVFQWSLNPLPNKRVYLAGDGWNVIGSSWSAGAFTSAQTVLNTHFGMSNDTHEPGRIKCAVSQE